jgi:hypothetical protein
VVWPQRKEKLTNTKEPRRRVHWFCREMLQSVKKGVKNLTEFFTSSVTIIHRSCKKFTKKKENCALRGQSRNQKLAMSTNTCTVAIVNQSKLCVNNNAFRRKYNKTSFKTQRLQAGLRLFLQVACTEVWIVLVTQLASLLRKLCGR